MRPCSPLRSVAFQLALPGVLGLLAVFTPAPGLAQERVAPEEVGMSSERLERLNGTFQAYVDQGRIPGAVIQVMREGRIVYQEAFGFRDVEGQDPQEVDDIFRIASQTKAIVSAAVLMLQEEGKLLISDPVGRYLPEFMETTVAERGEDGEVTVVAARRPITVRDLLTHTAGLGYWISDATTPAQDAVTREQRALGVRGWYFADQDEPIRETIRRMAAIPFNAQPGERYVYGYGTDVLGALVEVVSGMPLDRFLQDRIFGPLDMTDTHFYLPPGKVDRLATVYGLQDGVLTRAPDGSGRDAQGDYVDGPRVSFSGGAGLLSTARDYARFLQAILDGGELEGVRILSPKSVELMTVNHVGDLMGPGTGFGLGFQTVEDLGERGVPGSEGEFGWGGAYHSAYWGDFTEDLVVVYFTQVIPATGLDDHAKLRSLVYQAVTESYRDRAAGVR